MTALLSSLSPLLSVVFELVSLEFVVFLSVVPDSVVVPAEHALTETSAMADRPTRVRFMRIIITYNERPVNLPSGCQQCFYQDVISVTRYDLNETPDFAARMEKAMAAFASNKGCLGAHAGPCTDNPGTWVLVLHFDSIGSYRRALSSYRVKTDAVPLMYLARDELSAYETALTLSDDKIVSKTSDVDVIGERTATSTRPPRGHLPD